MLRLIIPGAELFNDETQEFSNMPDTKIDLEHSLVSLSKWESQYQKPFLSAGKKSPEELMGYLKAMVVTPNVDLGVLDTCTKSTVDEIQKYIDSPQTATTFGIMPESRGPGETITAELVYYWMVAFNVPFECQHWHLNRLFALLRICNLKNSPPKKMSKYQIAQKNREVNAQRKAKLGTRG